MFKFKMKNLKILIFTAIIINFLTLNIAYAEETPNTADKNFVKPPVFNPGLELVIG